MRSRLKLLAFLLVGMTCLWSMQSFSRSPSLEKTRLVKTNCPACYALADEHNKLIAMFDRMFEKSHRMLAEHLNDSNSIKRYESKISQNSKEIAELQKTISSTMHSLRRTEFIKTTINEKLARNKELEAEIVKIKEKQKKLIDEISVLNKQLTRMLKTLNEDKRELAKCEEENCGPRTQSSADQFSDATHVVPPPFLTAQCAKCASLAEKYNKIARRMHALARQIDEDQAYLDDLIAQRKREGRLSHGLSSLELQISRLVSDFNKLQPHLGRALEEYNRCVKKACDEKTHLRPVVPVRPDTPDAYLDTDHQDIVATTIDYGVSPHDAHYNGPFGSGSASRTIDGVGGTLEYERFLTNHPLWSVFGDVSLPGDDQGIILTDRIDPNSALNSNVRLNKQWELRAGAKRQVAEFGDCKADGHNSFNNACNSVSLGFGVAGLSQKMTAEMGELTMTTTSRTDLLISPFVVAETTLPICRRLNCSSTSVAATLAVRAGWVPKQSIMGTTPLGNTYSFHADSAFEYDVSAGFKFAV